MKALSVWLPWAMFFFERGSDGKPLKTFETRPMTIPGGYRGPVVICASKNRMSYHERFMISRSIPNELKNFFTSGQYTRLATNYDDLPFGKALGVVDFVDVIPTEDLDIDNYFAEYFLGDFANGRFAWEAKNPRAFAEPFPVRGQRGLFNLPDELIEGREFIHPRIEPPEETGVESPKSSYLARSPLPPPQRRGRSPFFSPAKYLHGRRRW